MRKKEKHDGPRAITISMPERNYNILNNIMQPLKTIEVEKDQYYEIESPFYKDRMLFRCTKSGKVIIKYRHTKGQDYLLLSGPGCLCPQPQLTEEMNYGKE